LNIPNLLSIFRLILVPIFVATYFGDSEYARIYAAIIFALAGITDFLDGRIARKYKMESRLGIILDPLGDKVMTFSALLCITIDKIIPLWAVVVYCVKELAMLFGGYLVYKKLTDMPSSNYFGKAATIVFIISCGLLILFKGIPVIWSTVIISFAIAVMLAAFVSYLIRYIKIIRSNKKPAN
jgi:cardiolipin synthase (CMP-forming)